MKISAVVAFLTDVMEDEGDIRVKAVTGFWINPNEKGEREIVCVGGNGKELVVAP